VKLTYRNFINATIMILCLGLVIEMSITLDTSSPVVFFVKIVYICTLIVIILKFILDLSFVR